MSDSDEEFSFTPAWTRKPPPKPVPAGGAPQPVASGRTMGPPGGGDRAMGPSFSGPSAFEERGMGGSGMGAMDRYHDGGGVGGEEGRERAMDLYHRELNDGIIFQGDDAEMLAQTIRAHQAQGGGSGACVYGVDLSSWPPNKPLLVCAAEYGRTQIVKALVKDFGCNINVRRSKDNNSAIHCAAYYGHDQTVEVLLGMGADVSSVNKFGEQPLQAARQGAEHWQGGQAKHKRNNQDPFYACFRALGIEPRHSDCAALLEAALRN